MHCPLNLRTDQQNLRQVVHFFQQFQLFLITQRSSDSISEWYERENSQISEALEACLLSGVEQHFRRSSKRKAMKQTKPRLLFQTADA